MRQKQGCDGFRVSYKLDRDTWHIVWNVIIRGERESIRVILPAELIEDQQWDTTRERLDRQLDKAVDYIKNRMLVEEGRL